MPRTAPVLLSLALALPAAAAPKPRPPADAPARLVGAALTDGIAEARLAELTDGIGPRLAGSPGAAAAVEWALRRFREDGLRAWTEPVTVAHWVRGEERAEVVRAAPLPPQALAVAALGGSAPTPPGGVAAEVIEARSLDEVRALGERVRGRIVLFQHDMPARGGYGDSVGLRARGPAEAARLGAVAALVRSLATASLRDAHAGQTSFPPDVAPIPAASVSIEDADLLHRLAARGPVAVRLVLGCGAGDPPEVRTANVIAELRGRERPDEIVVLAAHLDSWDLGTGAIDDGAGVAMVMEAMRAIAQLGIPPRRTVRAVLYMNEEDGLDGALAYASAHAAELPRHVAAIEADSGAGRPLGLAIEGGAPAGGLLGRVLAPLAAMGAAGVRDHEGGADLAPLGDGRVPTLGLWQDGARYFDWHHSPADTLDKVDPRELAAGAAALAVAGFGLAEADETLPRGAPAPASAWWRRPRSATPPPARPR